MHKYIHVSMCACITYVFMYLHMYGCKNPYVCRKTCMSIYVSVSKYLCRETCVIMYSHVHVCRQACMNCHRHEKGFGNKMMTFRTFG